MVVNLMLAAALAAASVEPQTIPAGDIPAVGAPAVEATAPPAKPQLVLPRGTMVRLMVLKEVNSRDNRPGDRFVLRVDEDVLVEGVKVIPIGAKGWGELVQSEKTAGVGKSGRISARLLYVEVNGRHIGVEGERQSSGSGGTGQVVASVLAFGPFGLFAKGNNATLKAGEILNGYTLADAPFDPPSGTP